MPEPSRRDGQSPARAQSVLTVIVHSSGELEFGLSPRDGEYGKHIAAKIKGPTQSPTPYRCRPGAVVQFRELTGQPLGAPTPITDLEIVTQERKGGTLRYLLAPKSLRGVGGVVVVVPVLPRKDAPKGGPRVSPPNTGARGEGTPSPGVGKSVGPAPVSGDVRAAGPIRAPSDVTALGDLKAPAIPSARPASVVPPQSKSAVSPASGGAAPSKPGMVAVDPDVEKALREALLKENSDLHDKIRRSNHTGPIRTWIDGYLEVAQARLKSSPTPMAHMAQVFLNPAYLSLKHADPGKAAETVMLVAAFFDGISKSSPAPLKKFARELLTKFQGEATPEEDKTVLGKRAPTPEELLAKLEDSKSSNAILESVNRQLFSVVGRGVHAARRIQTDVGKREALKTLTAVLDASQKTKAYKSMSTEDRVRFDAEVARERGRIDSLRRTTGLGS